ncbi:alkaline phosphatase D family protein [Candidatus Neomarinimicrobiota bacterium]
MTAARRDSTIIIEFSLPVEAKSLRVHIPELTRRYFNGDSVVEERVAASVSRIDEKQVWLQTDTSIRLPGLFRLVYEPGTWKYESGQKIEGFAVTIHNRLNLVEDWEPAKSRRWVGPNLWANRLQDWQVSEGRLECCLRDNNPPMRTVHAITKEVEVERGTEFHLTVELDGTGSHLRASNAMTGLLIGAGNDWLDYRAAAIVQANSGLGGGLLCVVDHGQNRLTFRDNRDEQQGTVYPELSNIQYFKGETAIASSDGDLLVELLVKSTGRDQYTLVLTGWSMQTGAFLGAAILEDRPSIDISGSIALAAHPGSAGFREAFGFDNFRCWGPMIRKRDDRKFGPIVGALYSFNQGVLRMTVQFMPVESPGNLLDRFPKPLLASLEIRSEGSKSWEVIDIARIAQPEYLAFFRIESWDATHDYDYRITFKDRSGEEHVYSGMIREDPVQRDVITFAALTGMGVMGRRADSDQLGEGADEVREQSPSGRWTPSNVWFPHGEIVAHIKGQNPDLIFFTGDQIYENNPTRPDRRDRFPVLDYLYKWYLWHWAFRDLTRDRPVICQIDDHDVYAGNVWGHSGALNLTGYNYDTGGFMMDPLFIQLVERTQCLHNPDPYRFTEPMKNSIQSYFGSLTYGGINFAILEDRKFKSPPPLGSYTPTDDILLGPAQHRFLDEWGRESSGAAVKVVISQTTYASTHTDWDDSGLKDYDSGGYPKEGRDLALEAFRKAGAFIVAGDQHLATITRMGIDQPGDAALQFCVPAAGNIYWRWFFPESLLRQWEQSGKRVVPDVSGDYRDGFGNHFRMLAVANPGDPEVMKIGRTHAWLPRTDDIIRKRVSKGDGYGRVIIDKAKRLITLECYPFDADLSKEKAAQFPGWPLTFTFDEL